MSDSCRFQHSEVYTLTAQIQEWPCALSLVSVVVVNRVMCTDRQHGEDRLGVVTGSEVWWVTDIARLLIDIKI